MIITSILGLLLAADPKASASDLVLFDFEEADAAAAWQNLVDPKAKEPVVKIEASAKNATTGARSLKLTFAGGDWPTVATRNVPANWLAYHAFSADVSVERECVVGFAVMQEKSLRGGGWDAGVSRWTKTAFLKPGKNTITGELQHESYSINKKFGDVVSLEIFLYQPHDGESIFVDNIRLSPAKVAVKPAVTKFAVLGTDLVVESVQELGKKLADKWSKPSERTLDQVEADFSAKFEKLRSQHPKVVKAVFRDGEKGYDPEHPDKIYAGWKDAYWSSHGPDGLTRERADNRGKSETHEIFMRHRSPLMKIDLSSIPKGSEILSAKLVIQRASKEYAKEHDPFARPTMWVAEPCNRPWEEYEVNAYQYAKDKFWKEIGGRYYGDDPDFLPVYVAHGPGGGMVNEWDFTNAVRFWTDGKHANHGFMLHGDARDWLGRAWSREAKEVKHRPQLYVIYEPK
jgi:hypothetical protein